MKYILFVDTNTDLSKDKADEYGIKLISMPYCVNGKDTYPYVDFDKYDYKSFYDMLRGGTIPVTSGISPQSYIEYFEPYFKKGLDVVYVHFSSAMSGTFNALKLAIESLKEKYPDRTLYTIDTKNITAGGYSIVLEIAKLYKSGKSIEELIEWSNKEIDKFSFYFFADDLKFFAKSGRVKGFKYIAGNIFKIKPLITVTDEGVMETVASIRGTQGTIDKIVQIVKNLADDIENYVVVIGHTDAEKLANILANKLQENFNNKLNIEFVVTNPTIGSHCGPNGVGVSFHAKKRNIDLKDLH